MLHVNLTPSLFQIWQLQVKETLNRDLLTFKNLLFQS